MPIQDLYAHVAAHSIALVGCNCCDIDLCIQKHATSLASAGCIHCMQHPGKAKLHADNNKGAAYSSTDLSLHLA